MPNAAEFQLTNTRDQAVTIANVASLSGAADLGGTVLVAYEVPASWTAAVITFQTSDDNSNFYNVYKSDGTEYSHTVDSSRRVMVSPAEAASLGRFIKFRSGTSGSPVNQSGAKVITLITRPV